MLNVEQGQVDLISVDTELVLKASIPVLGTSANRSASPQIRKLRTQGFGLRICEPISYRKHLRICGKKIKIYRKSANQQHLWDRFCNFQKNNMFLRFIVSTDLGG